MSKESIAVIKWRSRTKERIVQAFGGKCGICEYEKCQDALELHHLDPTKKEFTFGKIRANPRSWTKIVNELKKCVMLCCICHREYHAGMQIIPETITRFNESFSDYKEIENQDRRLNMMDTCPICGNEKPTSQKTCSYKCAAQMVRKYDWGKYDLRQMYVIDGIPQTHIAKMIGCSDVAVRKRLIKLGLKSK